MQALSEPPRFPPGLLAGLQQAPFPDPLPFVSFGWFEELSKPPVLTKPGLQASEQQFFTLNPLPRVSFAWFEGLSEPVRFKPGLLAALQQFYANDPTVIPTTKLMTWFEGLSEPPRFPPGLLAALQQFLAHPPQLRPTPNITGILNALETKDTMLAGASAFNRVTAAEVGIVATMSPAAQIGVAVPIAITSAKISIY